MGFEPKERRVRRQFQCANLENQIVWVTYTWVGGMPGGVEIGPAFDCASRCLQCGVMVGSVYAAAPDWSKCAHPDAGVNARER